MPRYHSDINNCTIRLCHESGPDFPVLLDMQKTNRRECRRFLPISTSFLISFLKQSVFFLIESLKILPYSWFSPEPWYAIFVLLYPVPNWRKQIRIKFFKLFLKFFHFISSRIENSVDWSVILSVYSLYYSRYCACFQLQLWKTVSWYSFNAPKQV